MRPASSQAFRQPVLIESMFTPVRELLNTNSNGPASCLSIINFLKTMSFIGNGSSPTSLALGDENGSSKKVHVFPSAGNCLMDVLTLQTEFVSVAQPPTASCPTVISPALAGAQPRPAFATLRPGLLLLHLLPFALCSLLSVDAKFATFHFGSRQLWSKSR